MSLQASERRCSVEEGSLSEERHLSRELSEVRDRTKQAFARREFLPEEKKGTPGLEMGCP